MIIECPTGMLVLGCALKMLEDGGDLTPLTEAKGAVVVYTGAERERLVFRVPGDEEYTEESGQPYMELPKTVDAPGGQLTAAQLEAAIGTAMTPFVRELCGGGCWGTGYGDVTAHEEDDDAIVVQYYD